MLKLHNSYGNLDYLTHLLPKLTLSAAVCMYKRKTAILSLVFALSKGQIISKGLFGILEFSQKRNERIRHSSSKNKFVRSFLGEFEETKSPFEII